MRDLADSLYPAIEPFRSGRLPVGDGHEIYFEESGNPEGKPVIVVHGGPGGGSYPAMRRFHDPDRYRIVLFDQRGCGRSTPNASLDANTTWHLVADMERIRVHLGIDRWQLFGGSWGSTLALAYAQTHPDRVTELVLRGIFMLRRSELLWFYQDGAGWVFPETFAPYKAHIPAAEQGDLIAAYYRRLTDPSPAAQVAAARLWSMWEGSALSLIPDPDRVRMFGADDYARAFARIECHYFVNKGFFDQDDQILRDAHKIRHIPGVIVHGRYDMCTPVKNAFDLAEVWPEAQLVIVPDGGHALTEPGIAAALIRATDRFATAG
ncbi:MAG: prolyl aminopeptidase [Hyphomicrobiaceae bacterium]